MLRHLFHRPRDVQWFLDNPQRLRARGQALRISAIYAFAGSLCFLNTALVPPRFSRPPAPL